MSIGFRNHRTSGSFSASEEKKAEVDLSDDVSVNRDYSVPFCAGVSKDGKTVYVDKSINLKAGGIDRLKPLLVHELVEHFLMDNLGLPYDHAHEIALTAEEAAVRLDGIPQHKYNQLWDADIRRCASQKHGRVPPDIDTDPYKQDGNGKDAEEEGLMSRAN